MKEEAITVFNRVLGKLQAKTRSALDKEQSLKRYMERASFAKLSDEKKERHKRRVNQAIRARIECENAERQMERTIEKQSPKEAANAVTMLAALAAGAEK